MTGASSQSDSPAAPDWAIIRQAYADRRLAVRDICRDHGIHSQMLYRRAEAEGWPLRRARRGDCGQRKSARMLDRLRRIAERQIGEIEARRAAASGPASPGDAERDARALTALARLIEHVEAIAAKHQAGRDGSGDMADPGSEAERARRRAALADKLIAMLEQERGAALPEDDPG